MTQEPNTKPEAPTYFIVQANAPFRNPFYITPSFHDPSLWALTVSFTKGHMCAHKFDSHADAVRAVASVQAGGWGADGPLTCIVWGINGCGEPNPPLSDFHVASIHTPQPDGKLGHHHIELQGPLRWFVRWTLLDDGAREVEKFRSFNNATEAHKFHNSLMESKYNDVFNVSPVSAYAESM